MIIDEKTLESFRMCERIAQRSGKPLSEVLADAGLLMTKYERLKHQLYVTTHILGSLEIPGPGQFKAATPTEMFREVIKTIRLVKESLEQRCYELSRGDINGTTHRKD